MKELIEKLKEKVIFEAGRIEFVHHKWFVKYHLEIVEKIAMELCDIYEKADRDLVKALVWTHDYSKISDGNIKKLLMTIGFGEDFIKMVVEGVELGDKKMEIDLSGEEIPLEVKILSSADGAAHFVGIFYSVYWYENGDKTIENLAESDIKKATKDWERKIVLPEARKAFEERYRFLLEQRGIYPERFLTV